MRPHISLNVRHVPQSVAFYEKAFATVPQKQTEDYAKFDLTEPPLNFTLVSTGGEISRVSHFGIEVEDAETFAAWKHRLSGWGLVESVQEAVTCCFAKQDKVWFRDPDGNGWEVFLVQEQLPVKGTLAETGCCAPQVEGKTEATPAACGCR